MPTSPAEPETRGVVAVTKLKPAPSRALADDVLGILRERILCGDFRPGERLPEEQLAEALEVSRGPVRNALAQLERERLVVKRRNRDTVVAQLSRADLEEVYSLRQAIDPLGCEWAARNAAAEDLVEMRAAVALLREPESPAEAAEVDLRLHDLFYRAARHKRLLLLWSELRPQVYAFLVLRPNVTEPAFGESTVRAHEELVSAIASGDESRARRVALQHVELSYRRVVAAYQAGEAIEHEAQ